MATQNIQLKDGNGNLLMPKTEAEMVSFNNADTQISSTDTRGAIVEIDDEIHGQTIGKYNADDIKADNIHGIINSTNGTINTQYPNWFTSRFLEIPDGVSSIDVVGVFPYNTYINSVGCYLYNANKQAIGFPSGFPTANTAATILLNLSSYPTAKYIRITCFKSKTPSGDDTYVSPVYIQGNRLSEFEEKIEENDDNINTILDETGDDVPFVYTGQFLNTTGGIVTDSRATDIRLTDYIPVAEGDVIDLKNICWGSLTLNHCWGYDAQRNPVQMLLGSYSIANPFSGKIVIPSGISFVLACGKTSYNPKFNIIRIKDNADYIKHPRLNIYGSFISNTGALNYNNALVSRIGRTPMIPVNEGDVYYLDRFGFSGESVFSQCYGFGADGSPVSELVGTYSKTNPFTGKIIIPEGVSYISAWGELVLKPIIYKKGTIYEDIDLASAEKVVRMNYLTVSQDGTNYNLIRELLSTIRDAAPDNQYTIIIPNGRYFECDLKGKKYVTLHGESKENTIIYCDGTSSNVTPSNYTYEDEANKALSSVNSQYKHIFHLADDLILENCTLQSNNVKYCIHFENSSWFKAVIRDCIFIATDNHSAVGMGLRHIQNVEFVRCKFVVTGCTNAIYIHNWDWMKTTAEYIPIHGGGIKVEFNQCLFENENQRWLTVGEIGSLNYDSISFVNCKTNNPAVRVLVEMINNRTYYIKPDGTYETDPLLVPYNQHLSMIGCVAENSIVYEKINRPDFENYCMVFN